MGGFFVTDLTALRIAPAGLLQGGQVCKRLRRRMKELDIEGFAAYRKRLDTHPEEWRALDGTTHITISRFFRDKSIFGALRAADIAAGA